MFIKPKLAPDQKRKRADGGRAARVCFFASSRLWMAMASYMTAVSEMRCVWCFRLSEHFF